MECAVFEVRLPDTPETSLPRKRPRCPEWWHHVGKARTKAHCIVTSLKVHKLRQGRSLPGRFCVNAFNEVLGAHHTGSPAGRPSPHCGWPDRRPGQCGVHILVARDEWWDVYSLSTSRVWLKTLVLLYSLFFFCSFVCFFMGGWVSEWVISG